MIKSYYSIAGLMASLLWLNSCGNKSGETTPGAGAKPNPPAMVEGYVVKTEQVSNSLTVPGTLQASESVELRSEIQGRITDIFFKEGTSVSKGQLLVKLYDADLKAEWKSLTSQKELAVKNENRLKKMLDINGISQQDYDAAVLKVAELDAAIELVQAKITRTEIRAPFAGTVGLRRISEGAVVSPADVLAVLVKNNPLNLDFTLQERYAYALNGKEKITFSVQGVEGTFPAKIVARESVLDNNSRSLKVRAHFDNAKGNLLAGAFATVAITFEDIPEAVLIPNQAVIPEARGKKVIVSRNGVAEFAQVITGTRDADRVMIESGIKPGDTIAITGLLRIRPGTEIRFKNLQNAKP